VSQQAFHFIEPCGDLVSINEDTSIAKCLFKSGRRMRDGWNPTARSFNTYPAKGLVFGRHQQDLSLTKHFANIWGVGHPCDIAAGRERASIRWDIRRKNHLLTIAAFDCKKLSLRQ